MTSLGTKRWIIPKGWPMEGHAPHEAAAREALEEAGLEGQIAREPVGDYNYEKRRRSGALVPCTVQVFPLDVTGQRKHWPEKGRREMKWMPAEEAARMVDDPSLGTLIRKWAAEAVSVTDKDEVLGNQIPGS